MPSLKFDMSDIAPLIGNLSLGQSPDATIPDHSKLAPLAAPALPPSPPPPTPAAAGFMDWKSDPQNQQKITSGMTPPNTPIIPPIPFLSPPQKQYASLNPPNVAPTPSPDSTALLPYQPLKGAAPTTINSPGTQTEDEYFAANPSQQARKQFSGGGKVQNILNGLAAATIGAGGGLKGNPGAGAEYVANGAARDAQVPEVNNSRYRAAVVQPQLDAIKAQEAAATVAHTQAQTGDIGAKHQQALAQHGLKEVTDANGNTTVVSDPDSPVTKANADKDLKIQAATDYLGAQTASAHAQKELREAQTAFTNNKSDPKSLVSQQIAARLATAKQNAQTSAGRLNQSQLTYQARYRGVGADGQALPGAMLTDDGTPVGSTFSENVRPTGTERNKSDMGKSAIDQIHTMRAIVATHPEFAGPGAGATQAFQRWLSSNGQDAGEFLAARQYLADHSAAVFGGRGEYISKQMEGLTDPNFSPSTLNGVLDRAETTAGMFSKAGTMRSAGSDAAKGITAPPTGGSKTYKQTASGAGGHKIGSNDGGNTWFDIQTGKALK